MHQPLTRLLSIGLAITLGGCAHHSTSRNWNGLMGADGEPTYYKETSKVAVNLFIAIPLAGNVSIDGMMRDLTEDIHKESGNNVRVVQGDSENYWYGFPPITWVFTPVITTVSAEYKPHIDTYVVDQKKIRQEQGETNYNPTQW